MVNIIKTMEIRIVFQNKKGGVNYLKRILNDLNVLSSFDYLHRKITINGETYDTERCIVYIKSIGDSDYATLIEKLGESKKYEYTIFEY